MKQKIFCLFLLVLTLFFTVSPVFASEKESTDLSKTTVEEDLESAGVDMELYVSRYGVETRIVTIREFGDMENCSSHDLYLYAYIPSFDCSCSIERVTFWTNGFALISSRWEFVQVSECGNFFKFRLCGIPTERFIKGNVRRYEFGKYIFIQGTDSLGEFKSFDYEINEDVDTIWYECSGSDKKKKQKRDEFRVKNTKDGRGHPTYIYARMGDEYSFLGITHARITKGVKNIPLERNPNPADREPSYIRPKADKSHRSSFGKKLKGWSFSENDKKKIDKYKK